MAQRFMIIDSPEFIVYEDRGEPQPRRERGEIGYNLYMEGTIKSYARVEFSGSYAAVWVNRSLGTVAAIKGYGLLIPTDCIRYLQSDNLGVLIQIDGGSDYAKAFSTRQYSNYIIKDKNPQAVGVFNIQRREPYGLTYGVV